MLTVGGHAQFALKLELRMYLNSVGCAELHERVYIATELSAPVHQFYLQSMYNHSSSIVCVGQATRTCQSFLGQIDPFRRDLRNHLFLSCSVFTLKSKRRSKCSFQALLIHSPQLCDLLVLLHVLTGYTNRFFSRFFFFFFSPFLFFTYVI